jgi:hypothetical protein
MSALFFAKQWPRYNSSAGIILITKSKFKNFGNFKMFEKNEY